MNCLLILSLAVLGASASCVTNTATCGCAPAVPGRNVFTQTPVLNNPTRVIPSCLPHASVSQSCHCLKTIVRPQIRNEIISVPEVDRIVRVVPSPVVEVSTVNVGGNTRNTHVPTCGVVGCGGAFGGVGTGLVGGFGGCGVNGGFIGGAYPGVFGGFNNGVVGFGGCNTGVVGLGGCNTGVVGCSTGVVGCNTGVVGLGGCNTGVVGLGGCNTGVVGCGTGVVGCNTGVVGCNNVVV